MKYVILHGSYGSPEENWFRWLEKELTKSGNSVLLKQFPVDDWDTVNKLGPTKINGYQSVQTLASWEKYFMGNIYPEIMGKPVVLIGHSIAPVFVLHMLEKYPLQITQAIFVAPFFNLPDRPEIWQFYPVNKTFYRYDFQFTQITKQIGQSYVVYGDDDPYLPPSEPPLFAAKLGSEIHIVPGGGHCGGKFKEFPLILELLNK